MSPRGQLHAPRALQTPQGPGSLQGRTTAEQNSPRFLPPAPPTDFSSPPPFSLCSRILISGAPSFPSVSDVNLGKFEGKEGWGGHTTTTKHRWCFQGHCREMLRDGAFPGGERAGSGERQSSVWVLLEERTPAESRPSPSPPRC